MGEALHDQALDTIFRQARTHNGWSDKPVSDDLLRQLYGLMKWGPTSANCNPARILFLRSRLLLRQAKTEHPVCDEQTVYFCGQ